jgi:hypothetical protein
VDERLQQLTQPQDKGWPKQFVNEAAAVGIDGIFEQLGRVGFLDKYHSLFEGGV